MDQNIEKRVKDLIRQSRASSEFRVSLVISLLREGLFEQAADLAIALVGTKHAAWFLYARAWNYLACGFPQEAKKALKEAYRLVDRGRDIWPSPIFSFTETGQPRLLPPFNSPRSETERGRMGLSDEAEVLGFTTAIFRENWLDLVTDINHNIREYKTVFQAVASAIEVVIHHDVETVSTAVAASESLDSTSARGNSFLMLTLMSDQHIRMVADTLWRICADWNKPLTLCEITSYLYYLMEEDEIALDLANSGLLLNASSLICGNVRALICNRLGRVYLADEQWRSTLTLAPDRAATYLVLGHQALCTGGLDAALRYFQEAVALGDNPAEAERFLTAALDCLSDDD